GGPARAAGRARRRRRRVGILRSHLRRGAGAPRARRRARRRARLRSSRRGARAFRRGRLGRCHTGSRSRWKPARHVRHGALTNGYSRGVRVALVVCWVIGRTAFAQAPAPSEPERRAAAQAACTAKQPCDWLATYAPLEQASLSRAVGARGYEIEPSPWG